MPYVGEIRMFAGNFAPVGWLFCQGQQLSISENEVLFQLIGTTYGGDGEETFNLPNLASRVPIHMGTGPDGMTYQMGEMGGAEMETLNTQQIPSHSHPVLANSNDAAFGVPAGAVLAKATSTQAGIRFYRAPAALTGLDPDTIAPVGGSQPHENCQPFLVINYIISLFGIFPSPT